MQNYTDIESQVEFGLEKIDPNRKIEISLRDFLYVHNVIGEFISFFHQPINYETPEDANNFLGNKERGALHLLWEIYYKKFYYQDIFPEDIKEMIDNGTFQNSEKFKQN
jgi:hypothetical protein